MLYSIIVSRNPFQIISLPTRDTPPRRHLMQVLVSCFQLRTLLAVSMFLNLFCICNNVWHLCADNPNKFVSSLT